MRETESADNIISEAEQEKNTVKNNVGDALEWFIGETGSLSKREYVVEDISDELGIDLEDANMVVSSLVGDIVDPVQQIAKKDGRYVGIIEFEKLSEHGAYRYVDYDAIEGKRKRLVCARCVDKHTDDSEVAHATEGYGSVNDGATWRDLKDKMQTHYEESHSVSPSDVSVGAVLNSGTTISGNTAWHDGNVSGGSNISIGATSVSVSPQGSGSGLNADQIDGQNASELGGGGPFFGKFSGFQFDEGSAVTTSLAGSIRVTSAVQSPGMAAAGRDMTRLSVGFTNVSFGQTDYYRYVFNGYTIPANTNVRVSVNQDASGYIFAGIFS